MVALRKITRSLHYELGIHQLGFVGQPRCQYLHPILIFGALVTKYIQHSFLVAVGRLDNSTIRCTKINVAKMSFCCINKIVPPAENAGQP